MGRKRKPEEARPARITHAEVKSLLLLWEQLTAPQRKRLKGFFYELKLLAAQFEDKTLQDREFMARVMANAFWMEDKAATLVNTVRKEQKRQLRELTQGIAHESAEQIRKQEGVANT